MLLDVFCMAGTELYRAVLDDVAEVYRRIPRERMLRTGNPVYRPGEQQRRDPCPQKGLGTRRRMTTCSPARRQPPMLRTAPERQIGRPSQPASGRGNLHQIGGSRATVAIRVVTIRNRCSGRRAALSMPSMHGWVIAVVRAAIRADLVLLRAGKPSGDATASGMFAEVPSDGFTRRLPVVAAVHWRHH